MSVATAAPARAQLANVTFATLERTTTNRAPTNLVRQDVVVSAVLTLLVFVVWGMFTG